MRRMVLFRTSMFPDETSALENDEYLKPGKHLAEWLAPRLSEAGIQIGNIGPEDWGWYVELRGDHGLIMVCCSKVDDTDDQWLIHTHETSGIGKWFSRAKGKAGKEPEVIKAIAAALANEKRLEQVGWIDESVKGWEALSSDPFAPPGKNDILAH
ncbi:MAG: hypothetical protein IPH75_03760 [bacterium]|nr:hypothetical protein [bacterium]